ncbi:MAG TPA: pseudouridine synthase [Actinomycetota bacterium]
MQKVLAAAGVASRRAVEEMIDQGRIAVDGKTVRVQGMRVDPEQARIEVDGRRVNVDVRYRYVALNKPAGIVSTASDEKGRATVTSLVKTPHRLYPVGRLDADTTGLILLTNHGEIAHRLTHPRYRVKKTYVAQVRGLVDAAALRALRAGVVLEDGFAKPRHAEVVSSSRTRTNVEVTMTEGRKRLVRRMLDSLGFPVVHLVRIRVGPIKLGELKMGEWRYLSHAEVGSLLRLTGL